MPGHNIFCDTNVLLYLLSDDQRKSNQAGCTRLYSEDMQHGQLIEDQRYVSIIRLYRRTLLQFSQLILPCELVLPQGMGTGIHPVQPSVISGFFTCCARSE